MIIPQLELCAKTFVDKTVVFYGTTDSGKSFFMKAVLKVLSEVIEQIVVFCPTDSQNGQYSASGMVPRPLIHATLTAEKLNTIIERQEMLVGMVTQANNPNNLHDLFDKIDRNATMEARRAIDAIYRTLEERKMRIMAGLEPEDVKRAAHEENLKKSEEMAHKIYKAAIKENQAALFASGLGENLATALRFMFTNPKMVLVFDDVTPELSAINSDPVIKKIFMQGRWLGITALIAAHTDKMLDPEIKKGVFINVFTHQVSAREFIERPSNNISKDIKKKADTIIQEGFGVKFQKLIYFREGHFAKCIAPYTPPFRFGSQLIWDFCAQVQVETNAGIPKNNRFYREFTAA
jgi:hypothetical protein